MKCRYKGKDNDGIFYVRCREKDCPKRGKADSKDPENSLIFKNE